MKHPFPAAMIAALVLVPGVALADGSSSTSVSGAQGLGVSASTTDLDNVGSPTLNSYGSDEVETVPSVDGPSLGVGTNPCLQVASGSANWLGFGGGFGATYNDRGCEIRNLSALIANMGYPKAAILLLADYDGDVENALIAAGDEVPASVRAALEANPATPPAPADQPREVPVAALGAGSQVASGVVVSDSPDAAPYQEITWTVVRNYDLPHWCQGKSASDQMSSGDRATCFGV